MQVQHYACYFIRIAYLFQFKFFFVQPNNSHRELWGSESESVCIEAISNFINAKKPTPYNNAETLFYFDESEKGRTRMQTRTKREGRREVGRQEREEGRWGRRKGMQNDPWAAHVTKRKANTEDVLKNRGTESPNTVKNYKNVDNKLMHLAVSESFLM